MIVTCKQCSTKFNLDDGLVKETGTKVRCSVCKDVFTAYPSPEVEQMRREEAIAEAEQALASDAEDLTGDFDEPPDELDGGKASDSEESPGHAESDELEDISRMFHMTGKPEDDLEGLDLDSDFEAVDSPGSKAEADDELDLSDLEESLDQDSETKPEAGDSAEELNLDLDLDFKEGIEAKGASEEELDLSDEDGLELEAETEPEEEKSAAEELDLDLDFDFDDRPGPEEAPEEELDLAELEEHLEIEEDREGGQSAESRTEESRLTSSEEEDLESIDLEESPDPESDIEPAEPSERDFDTMDLHLESEPDDTAAVEEQAGEAGDRFRLGPERAVEESNDLHLELESDSAAAPVEKADLLEPEASSPDSEPGSVPEGTDGKTENRSGEQKEESLEEENLDLSDIEKMIEEEEEPEGAPAAASAGAKGRADSGSARESSAAAELITEPALGDEGGGFEVPGEKVDSEAEDSGRKRKRIGTPVWILFLLVLLGAAGYGAFFAADRMGIRIPFVGQIGKKIPFLNSLIGPAVEDAGNLQISTVDIAGKFISNTGSGRLFVISGNAKNGYEEPRAMIKIAGSLYSQGKKLVKTEEVYCGNLISDADLAEMDMDTIGKRLKNRAGDNKSNMNVPPGRVVPFMLVFSNLPENLEEYTIEVKESFPAAKK